MAEIRGVFEGGWGGVGGGGCTLAYPTSPSEMSGSAPDETARGLFMNDVRNGGGRGVSAPSDGVWTWGGRGVEVLVDVIYG